MSEERILGDVLDDGIRLMQKISESERSFGIEELEPEAHRAAAEADMAILREYGLLKAFHDLEVVVEMTNLIRRAIYEELIHEYSGEGEEESVSAEVVE